LTEQTPFRSPRCFFKGTSFSILKFVGLTFLGLFLSGSGAFAQTPEKVKENPVATTTSSQTEAPITITLQDALGRARANSPQFQAATTEYRTAHEDRVQARDSLLPSVSYNNQYVYTQGNETPSGRYIANNAVHEYVSQMSIHQVFGLGQIEEYRKTAALEALAKAKSEIAARGLVAAVVQTFYGLVVSQRKYANTQQAANEAQHFLQITQDLERGGEVAHSDVIKAQLQSNDRHRDLTEARLAMDKARLTLAVLLFPDFNQNFAVVDDLHSPAALPAFADIRTLAQQNNPQVQAAMASVQAAEREVTVAKSGHLPSLVLDYFYGIDATRFATRTDGIPNLGYSAIATLNIPVFSWGATQSKVRQADYHRDQARLELTFAQRQLLSDLHALYNEASAARSELETLRSSAELAAESLCLTSLRYQAGEASALEVVDAQNTIAQARNSLDDGEARFRLALANLQTLTGPF
jgi:outer membrane protein TolC